MSIQHSIVEADAENMLNLNGEWTVGSARCTGFLAAKQQLEPRHWWDQVLRDEPVEIVSKPADRSWKISGPLGSDSLALEANFARFDWRLTPVNQPDQPARLPILSDQANANEFVAKMRSWLANAPQVQRLAFGATLLNRVSNISEGLRLLSRKLPGVKIDHENTREFFYQINRPRSSTTITDVQLNRLAKWSVVRLVPMALHILPGGQQTIVQPTHDSQIAAHLELDINSPAELQGSLTTSTLPELWEELIDLGCEIAVKGDIA